MIKKLKLIDLFSLLPFAVYLVAVFPYFGESPSLDPLVIYRESTQFYNGGLMEILSAGTTVHPPLIYLLNSMAFFVFGKDPMSYNLVGTLVFILSSIFLYFMIKSLFGIKTAVPMTILLFLNPLVIINSFYLMNDMLILMGTILAIGFYSCGRKYFLSATLALMTLMKETSYIIIFSIFLISFFRVIIKNEDIKNKLKQLAREMLIFIPAILIFLAWSYFLKSLGTTEWREPFFGAANQNSYIIIIENLYSLKIFNIFLSQNLRNAFLLNFQWIYLIGLIFYGLLYKRDILTLTKEQKYFFYILIIIILFYIILVFPFPTWTIPRYVLPILFPFFFFFAFFISRIRQQKLYLSMIMAFFILALISNFFSLDPLSLGKGKIEIHNQSFYNINYSNGGPDRIIYNTQFLNVVRDQNNFIKDIINKNSSIIIANCYDLKLGEKVYSINIHNDFYPQLKLHKQLHCISKSPTAIQ